MPIACLVDNMLYTRVIAIDLVLMMIYGWDCRLDVVLLWNVCLTLGVDHYLVDRWMILCYIASMNYSIGPFVLLIWVESSFGTLYWVGSVECNVTKLLPTSPNHFHPFLCSLTRVSITRSHYCPVEQKGWTPMLIPPLNLLKGAMF